jgi:hypothetical protein
MFVHADTLLGAQQMLSNLRALHQLTIKWPVHPMPCAVASTGLTSSLAFFYKSQLDHQLYAAGVLKVAEGVLTAAGPNPSPDAATHEANVAAFHAANALVYFLISRTFTMDNMGHAHTMNLAPYDGHALYTHIMAVHRGLTPSSRDDTLLKFFNSKLTPGTTPRLFVHEMRLQQQNLATVNHHISNYSLNATIIKGMDAVLSISASLSLKMYLDLDLSAFLLLLEKLLDLDVPFVVPLRLKRKRTVKSDSINNSGAPPSAASDLIPVSRICYNCGLAGDHYSNNCPEPFDSLAHARRRDEDRRARQTSGTGTPRRGSRRLRACDKIS